MSSAGTLLSDLDSRSSSNDSDLVEKILADMNGGGGSGSGNSVQMPARGMAQPPPPLPMQAPPGVTQGNTTFPMAADPMTAQAHVIGRDHPTPGDFAAAMHGVPRSAEGDSWSGGAAPRSSEYDEPKKNWYARILDDAKIPLVVAMLFFIFSLPAINVVISQYLPSLIQTTGQLSTMGMAAKSLIVGASFWFLLRIVAPLLKS